MVWLLSVHSDAEIACVPHASTDLLLIPPLPLADLAKQVVLNVSIPILPSARSA